ncbi:MAG: rod shape-determining protein RodA [Candidatus Moranbacteria bacterium]|nr:rod shape-determining protein RodA [Candidatus Moranbacteria bacterium]
MFYKFFKFDWLLISALLLLLGVGLLTLYSISTSDLSFGESLAIFKRQSIFAGLGILLMLFFGVLDYRYLKSYARTIYFASLILLLLVLVFGEVVRGTTGWISVGPVNLQPVEISKLGLIIALASFFSRKKGELGDVSKIIASLVISFCMIFLVISQPDFGSSMVLTGIWFSMLIFSGINKKYIVILFITGLIIAVSGWFFLADYQQERIANLFNPERDPQGTGYNVIQSIVAVGSGGVIGKGIGQGTQSQLNFLPEKHTDFIFAVIVEESGVMGALFVLTLFAVLFYRIKKIASRSSDNFGYLLAIGIMTMFFVQVLINVGMNLGIMPVTGIPLPILSYGGSSLVSIFISIGILLNVYVQKVEYSGSQVMQSH